MPRHCLRGLRRVRSSRAATARGRWRQELYWGATHLIVCCWTPKVAEESASPNTNRLSVRIAGWLTPQRFLLLLVLFSTFIVYGGTLEFGFVYDDHELIVENAYVHSWAYLRHYFREPMWGQFSSIGIQNYYRPLLDVWLRINHVLFGVRSWGWHLTSVLAHIAATWLVYALVRRLTNEGWTAILAGMIFGLHPAHTEAVAWISGVAEPLAALCLIPAFLCYLRQRERTGKSPGWLAASLLLYALAMLAKETALVLPLVVFGYDWLYRPGAMGQSRWGSFMERVRGALFSTLPYLALTAAYLLVRVKVIGGLSHVMTPLPFSTMIFTWPSLLWFYIQHLLWPVGLSEFYDTPYVRDPDLRHFVLPLAGLAVVAVGLRWYSKRRREVAFASAWLLLPLLPVLNIRAFPIGEVAHDRYLYLPSVGFAMIVAFALRQLRWGPAKLLGQPAIQVISAGLLAGMLGFGTAYGSLIWASDLALSYRGVAAAPHNARAWNNLGRAWGDRGLFDQAAKHFTKAVELEPGLWDANYNLAFLYSQQGEYKEAERYLERATRIDPFDSRAFMLQGTVKTRLGRLEEAAAAFARAIELSPEAAGYHFQLGMVYKMEGNLPAALKEFRSELEHPPENAAAREQIKEIEERLRGAQPSPSPPAGSVQPSTPQTR